MEQLITFILTLFIVSIENKGPLYPSCLQANVTWDYMSDTIPNVETPEDCQTYCYNSNQCLAFTWVSSNVSMFHNLCALFHSTDQEVPCTDCVSGPSKCVCSFQGECTMLEDNAIGSYLNIPDEISCQDICIEETGCNYYTYFSDGYQLQHLCLTFSTCEEIDETCQGCVTGPKQCQICSFEDMVNGQCKGCSGLGDQWTYYEDSCYKVLTGEHSQYSYRTNCQEEGGELPSVHSDMQNKFLTSLLRPNADLTWIGGYDCSYTCKWIDGSAWDWDNWASEEPDNVDGKDCIFIGYHETGNEEDTSWFDGSCDTSYYDVDAICKVNI